MLYTAEKQPAVFFATCARLIGPEVKLTIEQQQQGNLSPADWNLMLEIVDAVRQAIQMHQIVRPELCPSTFWGR